ncbi:MAG: hypothetical protein ACUVSC_10030, partial [Candidatus Fervidibacter sp.]|uniref:hypothetical protein n=1 Tax=Candidatus Fervidibacter sp. TaxID=3100871 RepID=UPI00404B8170
SSIALPLTLCVPTSNPKNALSAIACFPLHIPIIFQDQPNRHETLEQKIVKRQSVWSGMV